MFLIIGAGGMIGACARYGLGLFINRNAERIAPFPAGTFAINAAGSFLLGLFVNMHVAGTIGDPLYFFLGVGFCGAFTTFSTFGTETMNLVETQHFALAALYVLLSLVTFICFAGIGLVL